MIERTKFRKDLKIRFLTANSRKLAQFAVNFKIGNNLPFGISGCFKLFHQDHFSRFCQCS